MKENKAQEKAAAYYAVTHLKAEAISNKTTSLTEWRPHICPFCDKGFRFNSHLIVHLRVHTGERPFHCAYCPRSFKSSSNLNQHLKSAHGILLPYKCSKCDERFRLKNELLCHEPSHEGSDEAAEKQSTSIQSSSLQKSVKKSVTAPVQIQKSTKEGKSHKIPAESHDREKPKSKKTELKNKEKQSLEKKRKVVKVSSKTEVGNKSHKVNKIEIPEDDEIIVIYQGSKKEELLSKAFVNSDMQKIKKKKIVSQDVDNEPPQNKDHQNSKTNKKKDKQKIINIEKESHQITGDKNTNKEPIKLKRKRKTKKCEFIFRERIDSVRNLYEEEVIVIDDETSEAETAKECAENNKIDKKKRKGKRKMSENVENEASQNTEIQFIDINSSESSSHPQAKKKKKNDKEEEIIDIENQNIITIEDNDNEEAIKLKEKQKINNFEILLCSCGKYFSWTSEKEEKEIITEFKIHLLEKGHRCLKNHECPFCVDKSFKTIRAFELHFNKVHGDGSKEEDENSVYDSDEDGPLIHECYLCQSFRAFPDLKTLVRHLNKTH